MAKKHTIALDFDDEPSSFDDSAILFFQTDTTNYLFADDLNHLYRLALARVDDLSLLETSWPIYTYHDSISYLDYYLIDSPLTQSSIQAFKHLKLLIIRGEGTDEKVKEILRDFNEPPADSDPLLQGPDGDPLGTNPDRQRRNDIILSYQQALTSVSLYNPQPPAGLSRKAAKERQELDTLLTDLIDLIDLQHL